jgi:hypothetical protein
MNISPSKAGITQSWGTKFSLHDTGRGVCFHSSKQIQFQKENMLTCLSTQDNMQNERMLPHNRT